MQATVSLPSWSVHSKQDGCFTNSLHFTLLALFLTHQRSEGTPASHSTQSSQKTQLILNVHTSADTVCANVTRRAICSAGTNNELFPGCYGVTRGQSSLSYPPTTHIIGLLTSCHLLYFMCCLGSSGIFEWKAPPVFTGVSTVHFIGAQLIWLVIFASYGSLNYFVPVEQMSLKICVGLVW